MLKENIEKFIPINEQEESDKSYMLRVINDFNNYLSRDNIYCHFTTSAFIVNKEHSKVLCVFHNIYNSWSWVGGHADGEEDLLKKAKEEVEEETGLKNITELIEYASITSIPVASHKKRGKFVSAHVHLDIAHIFEADEKETIRIKADENSLVDWLTFDDLLTKSEEKHMIPIYSKLIEKLKLFDESNIK